jgi:cystathionine beta-lyase
VSLNQDNVMTSFDFDALIERRQTHSTKWSHPDPDMIPMWIADMDFAVPPAIQAALRARAEHPVFGYQFDVPSLRQILVERLASRHGIAAEPDHLVFSPGLVIALHAAARAVGEPGTGVVTLTPIYQPFLTAPGTASKSLITVPLASQNQDGILHYQIDFDALEHALDHADAAPRLFMLCNPHNPVGRAYTRAELERLAEICLRRDLVVCSDEIHADLTMPDGVHTSFASLSPEIADRTITLMAPSKAFNIPGLGMGFAVINNPALRARYKQLSESAGAFVTIFGFEAAQAAYTQGGAWLEALRTYLGENRDTLIAYVRKNMPQIALTRAEATYMAWLDCRHIGIESNPSRFFMEKAKVWMNDGAVYGGSGDGFVRLNYACPRARLLEALDRMCHALKG